MPVEMDGMIKDVWLIALKLQAVGFSLTGLLEVDVEVES